MTSYYYTVDCLINVIRISICYYNQHLIVQIMINMLTIYFSLEQVFHSHTQLRFGSTNRLVDALCDEIGAGAYCWQRRRLGADLRSSCRLLACPAAIFLKLQLNLCCVPECQACHLLG